MCKLGLGTRQSVGTSWAFCSARFQTSYWLPFDPPCSFYKLGCSLLRLFIAAHIDVGCMNKVQCIYAMESYTAIKKEIRTFAGKWMKLEAVLLSKISQTQKDKCRMLVLI